MTRYWLVNDAPTRETVDTPEEAITPDASGLPGPANHLLELTGWSLSTFLKTFSPRRNLWANPNRIWVAEGRQQAARIAEMSLADGSDGVIILGYRAAPMFNLQGAEPMEWHGGPHQKSRLRHRGFAFVPHPAFQSRYWTPEHCAQARAFFDSLLRPTTARRKTGG